MAITTGTVDSIKFGDDYGFFTIAVPGGGLEIFILWFGNLSSGGPVALYITLLTQAVSQGLTVDVSHAPTSAYVQQVRLRAGP